MNDDRRASAQHNTERDEVQITGAHDGLLRHSEKRPYDLPPEDEHKPGQGMLPAVTGDGAIQRTKAP
jgi:hypothetical protein